MNNLKHIKYFENFKQNNITQDDIIKCINNDGNIETNIVKNLPDNPTIIRPVSIDDTGEITVEIDGSLYEVDIKDVKKVIF